MFRPSLHLLRIGLSKFLLISLLLAFSMCSPSQQEEGEELAVKYCQGCHLLPNPQDLDRNTWEMEVLPKMAARLGYKVQNTAEVEALKAVNLWPDASSISREEWNTLKDYYLSNSPLFVGASPELPAHNPPLKDFKLLAPPLEGEAPFLTMLHFDQVSNKLFYGNSTGQSLNIYEAGKAKREGLRLSGSPSYLIAGDEGNYILSMGKVMPHNQETGALTYVSNDEEGGWGTPELKIQGLQRPVHGITGDLDGDEKEDVVIASFGNYRGELAWYSDFKSNDPQKHVLRALPGALKSVITDFNQDGRPDVLALMAQGSEGFFVYLNQGKGVFEEQVLMKFPPTYSSTYFEWKDMDGDGLEDIVYVNGDNGDYPPITKSFHGIRIFRNKGNSEFEQVLFLEQHGAFKTEIEDFDQDGDLDIAAISYFPDYIDHPSESFVYYENQGDLNYQAYSVEETPSGKWLTLESGDLDQDGDLDIILGSAMFMVSDAPRKITNDWRRKPTPLLVLENLLHGGNGSSSSLQR